MITYVNSVFVSNNTTDKGLAIDPELIKKGQFIIMNCDADAPSDNLYLTDVSKVNNIKIGMGTGKVSYDHEGVPHPEIRWSNIIKRNAVKALAFLDASSAEANETEDTVEVNFNGINANILSKLAEGGKRVIVRLTFKDLPTRYRKWTESYEYVTEIGDTANTIAENIATLINKQWKRARVVADGTTTAGTLSLTAMEYDDDNSVNSLSWANKVRFNVNLYYTDPAAEGWESLNKHYLTGVEVTKLPGRRYPASAKLVRDRENQSFGYLGVLNRGCCTWPIIQPEMNTNLEYTYSAITLEFENMYRAADDIFRKTKQTVEIYLGSKDGISLNQYSIVTALGEFSHILRLPNNSTTVAPSVSEAEPTA